jgi:Flp pilus assembly secretin CpaC
MRLSGKLPAIVAAAFGLLLVGTNVQGVVEAKNAQVTASTATQRVKLGLNKSVVIDLPSDAYDILVANPTVADAVTRTARRIYLFGKRRTSSSSVRTANRSSAWIWPSNATSPALRIISSASFRRRPSRWSC